MKRIQKIKLFDKVSDDEEINEWIKENASKIIQISYTAGKYYMHLAILYEPREPLKKVINLVKKK